MAHTQSVALAETRDSAPADIGAGRIRISGHSVETAIAETAVPKTADPETAVFETAVVEIEGAEIAVADTTIAETRAIGSKPVGAGMTSARGRVTIETGTIEPETTGAATIETETIETGPIETGPIETGPIETGPIETGPIETGTIETGPTGAGTTRAGRIRGGKNRLVQIRKPRVNEWSTAMQMRFLDALAMTGNVTTSVAVVGMSVGGAYNRRARDPAFAAGWQAALVRGYERLEELLLATALESVGGGIVGGTVGGIVGGTVGGTVAGGQTADDESESGDVGGNVGGGVGGGVGGDFGSGGGTATGPFGRGQAVPGAGLIQLSSVTAIQFALSMLNQHRADQARGRRKNQSHRATSIDTDAALGKLLDSLARRMAKDS
ncbi:hypothetical protein U1707_11765 [Sphingomonas sp. PB2P12]|uniref:hypothetical protein n=1 Tax=Sphingomonas sandaracina TaxID=3096157 RepID=UPI002FC93BE5